MLLKAGADAAKATDVSKEGLTPLHAAAMVGDAEIVSILLQQVGVEANALDNQRRSPLLLAVKSGHAEVAAKLLRGTPVLVVHHPLPQEGADPNVSSDDGKSLLEVALELENSSGSMLENAAEDPHRLSHMHPNHDSVVSVLQDKDLQFCNCTGRQPSLRKRHYPYWHELKSPTGGGVSFTLKPCETP
eukprot:7631154-Pyramimonas_sp.AAC.1